MCLSFSCGKVVFPFARSTLHPSTPPYSLLFPSHFSVQQLKDEFSEKGELVWDKVRSEIKSQSPVIALGPYPGSVAAVSLSIES